MTSRIKKPPRVLAACWLFLALSAGAQVYTPDVEYHDPVQRVFPVEAARVLAWNGASRGQITEISYEVSNKADGSSSWKLDWLDPRGKVAKSARVEYSPNLLKEGPLFYRAVMRQLLAAGWDAGGKMKPAEAVEAYWRGAGEAGVSREESLARAIKLASDPAGRTDPRWMPELAGLLIHAALPSIAGNVSLDPQLLARGAAWLALTELACSTNVARPWCPALFLAGRERIAAATWDKFVEPAPVGDLGDVIAAWDVWLNHPSTREIFSLAAKSAGGPMAPAMLAYDTRVNGSGSLLAELIEPMVGGPQELSKLHNYAPLFAMATTVGGGHILNGAWPVYQRFAWVGLLAEGSKLPESGVDYGPSLNNATNALAALGQPDEAVDHSLYGFKAVSPLVELGRREGVGKLGPTAVVSKRDLLNYGYEMAGLEMGARYQFVNARWGFPEQAKPIYESVTELVQGVSPFFLNANSARLENYHQFQLRFQQIQGFYNLNGGSPSPFYDPATALKSDAGARLFMKRCWLRPADFEWQARLLFNEARFESIGELVDSMRECGPLGAVSVLKYLDQIRPEQMGGLQKAREWQPSLAETLPQTTRLSIHSLWQRKFAHLPDLECAKETEKLYWTNPDSQIEDLVLIPYAHAGAFHAARRFYLEARENFTDPLVVASSTGRDAFLLGYLLHDDDLRQKALEDSACGSYQDMLLHIWDEGEKDRRRELAKAADELIERYEAGLGAEALGGKLKGFLPLLPALADPHHAGHAAALRYFGKYPGLVILRWIWIEHFKLSKDDAVVFLGGRETDAFRHAMICYLDGDRATMKGLAENFLHWAREGSDHRILVRFLWSKLDQTAREPEVPDLKPAGSVSVRKMVQAQLSNGRAK